MIHTFQITIATACTNTNIAPTMRFSSLFICSIDLLVDLACIHHRALYYAFWNSCHIIV